MRLYLPQLSQYLKSFAQKMKFSIKDFFSKSDQIRRKLLLKKSLMENFIFCAVSFGSKRQFYVNIIINCNTQL